MSSTNKKLEDIIETLKVSKPTPGVDQEHPYKYHRIRVGITEAMIYNLHTILSSLLRAVKIFIE